jgi:hypothetical protein
MRITLKYLSLANQISFHPSSVLHSICHIDFNLFQSWQDQHSLHTSMQFICIVSVLHMGRRDGTGEE